MTVFLCLQGPAFASMSALQAKSVNRQVAQRLKSIKPKNTKLWVYQVRVPLRPLELPSSLRMDLVYKIGHYSWDLVALRFERHNGSPYVDISQVVFSSAFPFIKVDMNVTDSYSVRHGKLSVKDFDRLLTLAYTLYRSDIEAEYVGSPGKSYGSVTGSSGDGTILLQLAKVPPEPRSIIRESGTLHVGNLANRVEGGYESVRVHLFWEVFYEYLKTHSILNDMEREQAVDLLIERLKEPPMADDYRDFFRQTLYVETLGELGSARAIQALREAAENSKLEEDWKTFLKRDVSEAIERINTQSKEGPR